MTHKVIEVLTQHKTYLVIAIAALSILAYGVPYAMDVEAKHSPGHPGNAQGYGQGLSCDHFVGKPGPLRCR
jgi:hypothetical protein